MFGSVKKLFERGVDDIKPGMLTTEWWSHLILAALGVLVSIHVIPVGLPTRYAVWVQVAGLGLAGLSALGYYLSRGAAKANSPSRASLIATLGNLLSMDGIPTEVETAGKTLLAHLVPGIDLSAVTPSQLSRLATLLKEVEAKADTALQGLGRKQATGVAGLPPAPPPLPPSAPLPAPVPPAPAAPAAPVAVTPPAPDQVVPATSGFVGPATTTISTGGVVPVSSTTGPDLTQPPANWPSDEQLVAAVPAAVDPVPASS